MVVEVETDTLIGKLLVDIGSLALWLQAIGVVVFLWMVFQGIILYFNHKRMKEVYKIKEDMKRIEMKIDKLRK
ncbi:hypothetical protein COU54_05150 [Candidatus Pacearchaeota archaeon CG10_big_fil_rev_8_21_14_0_10_31_24]|nr:MAG: hypothetical protein COU54_05150 [Candidatus Pacearchaeota archaeon CG10_big_fil_rev_8_21_14_0_10_31_24]